YGQSGPAFGITAGGNMGKGYGNGDETSYRSSHIGDSGSQTTLQSGGATNIIGGQIIGKGVQLDATELNIASLQDTATFEGKQQNMSGQVTVGYGASASASYSQSKIKADYASVNEQSGIFAGEDGYQINVKGNTDLKGALITSAQSAEENNKNQLSTGSLTFSDIQNHADYEGESFGISGSGGFNTDMGLGEYAANQSSATHEVSDANGNTTTVRTEGKESVETSRSIGFGSDSGHTSSITQSGINTANIVITDEAKQQELTGKTAEEIKLAIKTDISTEDYAQHTGYLKNNFDRNKVLAELNLQVEVTQKFGSTAQSMIDAYTLPKQKELREKIKATTNEEEKTALYEEIYKLQYQKRFLETLVGMITADPTAAVTQGTLQVAATKMREESLANSRQSPGIVIDDKGTVVNNVSYDSGSFDGVKLGGVRVGLDKICGEDNSRCRTAENDSTILLKDNNGNYIFKPTKEYPTYQDVLKDKTISGGLYGLTGGFQPIEGGWYLPGGITISYKPGSFSDKLIESFSGTHDYLGGQVPGFYGTDGNTSRGRSTFENIASNITTVVALPVSAPFALSDLISSDVMQLILQLGK
uniref:hemagglutinin repeat-containing protein n=1 Tax=Stenoxybacter acetivorans TaxID=422441 RepID=UPI00056D8568